MRGIFIGSALGALTWAGVIALLYAMRVLG